MPNLMSRPIIFPYSAFEDVRKVKIHAFLVTY